MESMICSTLESLTPRLALVAHYVHGFVNFRMSLLLKELSNPFYQVKGFRQQRMVGDSVFQGKRQGNHKLDDQFGIQNGVELAWVQYGMSVRESCKF